MAKTLDFNDYPRSVSSRLGSYEIEKWNREKLITREEIKEQVAKYLQNGGSIKKIEITEPMVFEYMKMGNRTF